MEFLQLFPSAKYEYYGREGMVFDILSKARVELNEKDAARFNELLNGKEYICEECSDELNKAVNVMMEEGLLYSYPRHIYYEPMRLHNIFEIKGMFDSPPYFENIFIEASDQCGRSCSFCSMDKVEGGCKSCVKWEKNNKKTSEDILLKSIERLMDIPAKKVTILGGDPLMNWGYVTAVVKRIREKQAELPITMHMVNINLSEKIREYIKKNRIDIKAVLTDEKDASLFDSMIKVLKEDEINVKAVLVGEHKDLCKMKELLDIPDDEPEEVEVINFIRPPHTALKYEERKKLDIDETFVDRKGNRCTYKKVAVSLSGKVSLCPAERKEILNVNQRNIEEIFYDGYIDNLWSQSRNGIKGCDECSLKWLCDDCICALHKADALGLGGFYFCGKKHIDNN
ncbi:Radical SAM superfamily protein [Eubacterium ruminantium]|nr:Radical SAM superfamily protein [Eubacterium ruminantium]